MPPQAADAPLAGPPSPAPPPPSDGVLDELHAGHLRALVRACRDALRSHQEVVNALNVFPVPDGDTGTNMALTLESVVAAVDALGDGEEMAPVCAEIRTGSLMGARGNSGVIVSQVLRGFAGACSAAGVVGAEDLAAALRSAADAAYEAVMNPVEGTMLSVARAAAEGAEAAVAAEGPEAGGAGGSPTLGGVAVAARQAARDALARTPEQLAVLAEAGVVDAGGAGFVLFLDALVHVVTGEALPEPPAGGQPAAPIAPAAASPAGHDAGAAHGDGGSRYEVMHLLEADGAAVAALKEAWSAIGDSIAVVGGEGLWNCHVHTSDIGAAIEAAIDAGRPRHIRVTDLFEQVAAHACEPPPAAAGAEATAATGVVAVAAGDGVAELLRSLGAGRVVAGGQSMNPSTAEVLEAVEALPVAGVVVLPNNDNVVPVARRAAEMASKPVRVVPTATVPEGMAALVALSPDAGVDANAEAMAAAAAQVVSGEVACAVRSSTSPAGPVAEGDWLGLSGREIRVVAPTMVGAATGLLEALVEEGHELVTVLEGAGASAGDTAQLRAWLAEHRPGVECEVHAGGQPLYPYLFSVE